MTEYLNLHHHLDALIRERRIDISDKELKHFLDCLVEQGHLDRDYEIDVLEEPWFFHQFATYLHLIDEV